MKRTTYQVPELRDENDNIIQQGAFGKNTALANATNDGWIDYVANDLMYLYNNTMGGTGGEINTETITGKTGTITNLTATTVKADTLTADALNGPLTGDVTGNLTGNVTGTADKATSDAAGNNIQTTYAKKSDLSSSVSTTSLTVTGTTSVPTANAGNSSKAIANTEYVQGELTSYLPLSGGTLTGVVNGVTPTAGDNSTKIATTEFVNAKAGNYLPLSGGTMTGDINMAKHNIIGGTSTNTGIYCAGNDNGGTLGTTGANINIKSWYGVGFINGLSSSNTYNKVTVGIDVREGIVHAKSFDGNAASATKATNDGNGNNIASTYLPAVVGAVVAFAGKTAPQGWLLCDGSAVSRTTYAKLFSVIGTTYGSGNGSTTFNLPNLVDKFVEGSATAGTVKSAGLPNITGKFGLRPVDGGQNVTWETNDGAVKATTETGDRSNCVAKGSSQGPLINVTIDASRSSAIYGKSDTVQPPALTMRYIIKY